MAYEKDLSFFRRLMQNYHLQTLRFPIDQLPEVDLGREIRSVRCLTKYPGFRIPVNGTRLQMRIPGRGAEAIEVEFT